MLKKKKAKAIPGEKHGEPQKTKRGGVLKKLLYLVQVTWRYKSYMISFLEITEVVVDNMLFRFGEVCNYLCLDLCSWKSFVLLLEFLGCLVCTFGCALSMSCCFCVMPSRAEANPLLRKLGEALSWIFVSWKFLEKIIRKSNIITLSKITLLHYHYQLLGFCSSKLKPPKNNHLKCCGSWCPSRPFIQKKYNPNQT